MNICKFKSTYTLCDKKYIKPGLNYWLRESKKSNAEIDFVISVGDQIIPVEVKAGKKGTLKSLFQFFVKKKSPLGIRFDCNKPTLQNAEHALISELNKQNVSFPLLSLPLYLVEETSRLIKEYINQ